MAQTPAYPAQGAPGANNPASAYPVQGAPLVPQVTNPLPQQKESKFDSFMRGVDKVGKQISKGIRSAPKKVEEKVDENWWSATLDMFKHGNTVQLLSRSSGRTVQIVKNPIGLMILDAMGPLDPNALNSLWLVVNEGKNQIRLHNYNNYIAVVNGETTVISVPPGTMQVPETKFQLCQTQQFVALESLVERNFHVGFVNTGLLKPARYTDKGIDGQFGVKLVSTAYPVVTTN